ncbi:MAG TPA: FKBP-type peptidyl-prolyl cis-trans isomerase [Leptospiraceae bacterium]|nr:FKBP-type peptidyl-prolyl cis-trans isomerase [Leptospiraceae bacterium]HNF15673.1 FKBP-type peptidyl-prolyl cis-trans isomerase [Leptospiraceae bacterium]HNF26500.1 FKBP-type peptidyl-prolyl cis-trans isomerase [Leptospiraceae bacterium]HNH09744.1 FKBP-type peptidyl-prolyl cis-trans isomerase [Leptospiraceae bacterium]HNI26037.1 FKBP-type peptidyl-prolyl cis-trans isomerase [Leptospiraceae bacterium]
MKKILGLAAAAAVICTAAVFAQSKPVVKGGLKMEDQVVGTGKEATAGRLVSVHYTGWLADKDKNPDKKKKFDSSVDRKQPFEFTLGAGMVIKGWDQGVQGMRVGGKRRLTIAPELGYGDRGAGGVIPGGATLVFDVELLDVK